MIGNGAATIGSQLQGTNFNNANYAQRDYDTRFSKSGSQKYSNLVGEPVKTVNDLTNAITSGKVSVQEIPVNYIQKDGNTLILNTRTSVALTNAGVPRNDWNFNNVTNDSLQQTLLNDQLSRNNLTSSGIPIVYPRK